MATEGSCYDEIEISDISRRWRGIFIDSLYKICQDVHVGTAIDRKALDHVEELIVKLLVQIIETEPRSVHDVEKYVECTFPQPINQWAIREAQEAVARGHPARKLRKTGDNKPVMPMNKIHPILRDQLGFKIDLQLTAYIVAVLEYIAADILKLTGNYVKNIRSDQITLQDLKVALRADRGVLMDMFYHDNDDEATGLAVLNADDFVTMKTQECTYEKAAKDLIHDEQQFLKDLNLLIHVFKRNLEEALPPHSQDVEVVFGGNIMDIHELTVKFLRSLEDCVEMGDTPSVGSCFLEMAEGAEFEAYFYYAQEILRPICLETLYSILQQQPVRRKLEV